MTVVFLIMNDGHSTIYFHISRKNKTNSQIHKLKFLDRPDYQYVTSLLLIINVLIHEMRPYDFFVHSNHSIIDQSKRIIRTTPCVADI